MQFLNKAKLQFEFKDKYRVKWFSLKKDLLLYLGDKPLKTGSVKINTKDLIRVPKEVFLTDLASVPNMLQWIYKSNGKYTRASIIHDWLYSQRDIKRSYADKIFLKCMKIDKVDFFTRWIFYVAVRIGGKPYKA